MFANIRASAELSDEEFDALFGDQTFVTDIAKDQIVPLVPGGEHIKLTKQNYKEYIRLATEVTFNRARWQMEHLLQGITEMIPEYLLRLVDWRVLRDRAAGQQEIDIEALRVNTEYHCDESADYIEWFWEILHEFTEEEKRLYVKFVNGSSRLPRNLGAGGNRSHTIST